MKVVKIQFHNLDKEYFFLPEFTEPDQGQVAVGDRVVVETAIGQDIGTVLDFTDWQVDNDQQASDKNNELIQNDEQDVKPMLRKLSKDDNELWQKAKSEAKKCLTKCRELAREHKLNMKLVDSNQSFDGKRLTFYFVADNRVDFRDLVKDLVKLYHKKIRLQQVGVRDAAKIGGDFGPCGLPLCCKSWMNEVGNVSPDFIKNQELSHRGADRLTGPCGRLKCCLRFEEEAYKYQRGKLPKVGDIISTGAGQAKVVAVHPMKQTVDLAIDDGVVEYPYAEGKVCTKESCEN